MDVLATVVSALIAATNGCSNLCLVLITWKSRRLRSPCNLLIGFESLLYGTFAHFYSYMFPYLVSAMWTTISFPNCFLGILPALIAVGAVSVMPLFIAVERFIGVYFPMWAMKQKRFEYAAVMASLAVFYGIVENATFAYQIYTQFPNVKLSNCPGRIFGSSIGKFSNFKNYVVIFSSWILYAAILIRVLAIGQGSQSNEQRILNKNLLRSLSVIVALISFSWLVPAVTAHFNAAYPSPSMATLAQFLQFTAPNIGAALTLPSLFYFSGQYRQAIKEVCAKYKAFQPTSIQPQLFNVRTNSVHPRSTQPA